ncbi:anti-sigma factor [Pontibacter arcticus]|uniref:Regulator of SigK n=1 Tax=Pontibacter arcticus TaxID=2080288 RepID=A0A364RBK7_9BACT|nr:anti-sigma factor [Pontibacter arcticus]RAU81730.1 hypothetical protein DP923_13585 [Pontibacter arcticus]
MNNENYIASGVLELYAAGALTHEERQEVETLAAASPEIKAALDEACAVMENYARLYAVQPQPALKNRILNQLGAQPITTEAPYTSPDQDNVIPFYVDEEREGNPYKWMMAASVVLFLLSGILSFHFYNKWQEAENRLALAMVAEQQLAQNFSTVSGQLKQQEQLLTILQDEAYKPVKLQGVEAHPEARAIVYWNQQEKQVYLNTLALPQAPAGKQYQLWALYDGKPVDAGTLALTNITGLQQMKTIGAAQAFAITLEPEGGSVNPTLEQLFVMGEVKS